MIDKPYQRRHFCIMSSTRLHYGIDLGFCRFDRTFRGIALRMRLLASCVRFGSALLRFGVTLLHLSKAFLFLSKRPLASSCSCVARVSNPCISVRRASTSF